MWQRTSTRPRNPKNPNILSVLGGKTHFLILSWFHSMGQISSPLEKYPRISWYIWFSSVFRCYENQIKKVRKCHGRYQSHCFRVGYFSGLTVLLMIVLVVAMIRYHVKVFHHEIILGRLVWADPVYFGVHILSVMLYMICGFSCALLIFEFWNLIYSFS